MARMWFTQCYLFYLILFLIHNIIGRLNVCLLHAIASVWFAQSTTLSFATSTSDLALGGSSQDP